MALAACYVNAFAYAENFDEILLPKNVTATIATIAMKATRIPYSASAAPSSFAMKLRIALRTLAIGRSGKKI
jgi:hypothetical protein